MYPLNLGFVNFDKTLSRTHRDQMLKLNGRDRGVLSPDIYTHHDNAIRAQLDINSSAKGCTLSNSRFENSSPRDQKMYQISDLQNLDHEKYLKSKNAIDKYLELNNILPHQQTLAHGYTKGSQYDKVLKGHFKEVLAPKSFGKRK